MKTPAERLQHARRLAGYANATDAAEAIGMARPTYLAHENGGRGFAKYADRYARFFRVSYEWLMTGRGEPKASWDSMIGTLDLEDQEEVRRFIDYVRIRRGQKSA